MRESARARLATGTVIPAIPLVLDQNRKFDENGQRRLVRYYLAAGAGGIAVAVHTTQFAIRNPEIGLYQPVLQTTADEVARYEKRTGKTIIKVAGVCGTQPQALREAAIAAGLGFDAVLLSPSGLPDLSEAEMLERTRAVASLLPVIGFYLQPAAGGRLFSFAYWQGLCAVENVVAIKAAPFNRYQTLEVLRAVALSGRSDQIALYTGNDDHIFLDLLTDHVFEEDGQEYRVRFVGGLLGQWAVWTKRAVDLFNQLQADRAQGLATAAWLTLASQLTDCNGAIFDAGHKFQGSIAGIHEILRRQGLLAGIWTLDPTETLSPGQAAELDRIQRQYPHLNDDAFVRDFLAAERA